MSVGAFTGADLFALNSGSTLYFAFEATDDTNQDTDSVSIYLDVNANGGDPDEPDRRISIDRDGTIGYALGSGTNSDGNTWTVATPPPGLTVETANDLAFWSAEAAVPINQLLPTLGETFGLMGQVIFTEQGIDEYPADADPVAPNTWRLVELQTPCP